MDKSRTRSTYSGQAICKTLASQSNMMAKITGCWLQLVFFNVWGSILFVTKCLCFASTKFQRLFLLLKDQSSDRQHQLDWRMPSTFFEIDTIIPWFNCPWGTITSRLLDVFDIFCRWVFHWKIFNTHMKAHMLHQPKWWDEIVSKLQRLLTCLDISSFLCKSFRKNGVQTGAAGCSTNLPIYHSSPRFMRLMTHVDLSWIKGTTEKPLQPLPSAGPT